MPSSKQDLIRDIVEMQQEMMRSFQDLLLSSKPVPSLHGQGWCPPTDVHETAEEYVIRMEIPGIDPAQLDIQLDGNLLSVNGNRPDPAGRECGQFLQMEIHYGAFQRVIRLPAPVEESQVDAVYSNGFLQFRIRKAREKRKTRVILRK